MTILMFIIILALIGFVSYLIIRFVPMPKEIQTFIIVTVIILCTLWLLNLIGLLPLGGPLIPRVR